MSHFPPSILVTKPEYDTLLSTLATPSTSGALVYSARFSSVNNQTIGTTSSKIVFGSKDEEIGTGYITANADGSFNILKAATYSFTLRLQMQRTSSLVAAQTTFYARKNGTVVSNIAADAVLALLGETLIVPITFDAKCVVGDVVDFMSVASAAAAVSLNFRSGTPNAPSASLLIQAYS